MRIVTIRGVRQATSLTDDPLWFKDAILYEVRVRSFNDSNGDGIGDFAGLTQKLDYIQDLGVTAVWLLPFYPSPGKDDGYDISDYTEVGLDYGSIDDFKTFLEQAHRRGLRVITELVINHSSDQHPWFQRSRRSPPGSSWRDFYVWSETPEKFREARIIFKDFEPSNWSWDPVAKSYYWHRFFSHQPDLNFHNPDVQKAVFEVCDFWLDMGVDGMRLDAIPYLYEAEGTNCENLPETHQFLKQLRAHIDGKYKNRMLLAEANQWPEDAAAYFGNGDECHMNFHFPIMPRIFMSIHREDRLPVIDILEQTPAIPDNCQWALFLRNHDELTLEMVTDDERDYMYRAFASDPSMRINLGIRRRLAPLLENDRPNIELMNSLLFSLPGTPVVYYGDELGMGDNVYLGDRNGVRTPMQWSADRNAGFSRANPQKLMLPVIIDPEYHYESINVEAQQNNSHSLLWWMKRTLALRKRYQVFGRGSIEFLQPTNPRVLAFVRHWGEQTILVVCNLSRLVQYVELDLGRWKGLVPRELFGGTKFPPVTDGPYLLTLGGHQFYWFSLERTAFTAQSARAEAYQPTAIVPEGKPANIFESGSWATLAEVLPNYLASQAWFHRLKVPPSSLEGLQVALAAPLIDDIWSVVVRSQPGADTDEAREAFHLVLTLDEGEAAAQVRARSPNAIVAHFTSSADGSPDPNGAELVDVLADAPSSRPLLQAFQQGLHLHRPRGELVAVMVQPIEDGLSLEPRLTRHGHRSAAVVYGDQLILKFARRLEEGISPDVEITEFLNDKLPRAPTVPLVGKLLFRPRRGETRVVAALQGYWPHDEDAWKLTSNELSRFYERVLTRGREVPLPAQPLPSLLDLGSVELPAPIGEAMGAFLQTLKLMGQRVAELHRALSSDTSNPAFSPEAYSTFDQRGNYQSSRNLAGAVLRRLRDELGRLSPPQAAAARLLLDQQGQLFRRFQSLLGQRLTALRTRIHGDLDLHHLLHNGKDFKVIDFDQDPGRPLSERRRKRSPLRDVASLLVSLHWAAFTAFRDPAVVRPEDRGQAEPWANVWQIYAMGTLLESYYANAREAIYLPPGPEERRILMENFFFDYALVDLNRQLDEGLEATEIPLRLILQLLGLTANFEVTAETPKA